MKTHLITDVISDNELFFMYKELVSCPNWSVAGISGELEYSSNKQFSHAPLFTIKTPGNPIANYPLFLYVNTLVFRIAEILKNKNIGMHTKIRRSWFNITYSDSENHWLHQDSKSELELQTLLIFMTPIWKNSWEGSLYVDGEKFEFKPGSAVLFDSKEFHAGKKPIKETDNWMRMTLNIILEP
jgi:hypothetical protein